MATTLVLGGPRSGKTRHAEALLRDHDHVTYVATRPRPGPDEDSDLRARIERHRAARRPSWQTLESTDLTRALLGSRQPVLIDCLTEWIRSHLTAGQLWDDHAGAHEAIDALLAELAVAARAMPFPVVLVAREMSWGPLPQDRHERLLVDLNGHVNQTLSASCHQVHAVIAGRVLDLSQAPLVA